FVGRSVQVIPGGVYDVRVVERKHDRVRPLEADLDVLGRVAHRVVGPHGDVPLIIRGQVLPRHETAVAAGEDDVRLCRMRGDVAGLTATGVDPIGGRDPASLAA